MTQISRQAAIDPAADTPADMAGEGSFAVSDALEWLWGLFTSMRMALALMLGLALMALIGALVIQAPPGLAADPDAYNAWLVTLKPRYGGFTTVFDKLGFFAVFQSIWFRLLAVALTTSILACSAKRFPGLWKAAVHPRTKMSHSFYESAPFGTTIEAQAPAEQALETTRRVFRSHRFRTVVDHSDEVAGEHHLYVDQHRWSPFGTVIAHLSVVVILIGAMVGTMLGYRNEQLAVPVGSTVAVGGDTNLSVMARSFSDSYYENGAPSDYASTIALYRDGQEVAAKTIRVNDPLSFDGTTFYQSFFGPAAVMHVTDAAGSELFSGGVPLLWSSDDSTRRIGQLDLSDAGIIAYVVGAASGRIDTSIRPGEMQLEVYRVGEDQPFAIEIVAQGQPLAIGDLSYTFQREQQYTGLIVNRDPGEMIVWLGALALVFGLFLVFMFPNRRIWIAVKQRPGGGEVSLGATARHDAAFAPEFNRLTEQVRQALQQAR